MRLMKFEMVPYLIRLNINRWLHLLAIILFITDTSCEKQVCFERRPYRFDPGKFKVSVQKGAISLSPQDKYTTEKGYGWTEIPARGFYCNDLKKSRSEFTIDGVVDQQIAFQVDIPAGDWWLTLWVEAGKEDSSTLSLFINNVEQNLNWHPFLPPAEPRSSIQDIFRLSHGRVNLDSTGLNIRLIGANDLVRLLGFSVIPDPPPIKKVHYSIFEKIRKAGKYGSEISLDDILTDLNNILRSDPYDPFAFYWQEQLRLMALAEYYIELMGWQWADEKTGLKIFSRYHQAVIILDGLLDGRSPESYPLYERALWQRGRLLYWLGKERHGKNEISGGKRDLAQLYRRYPGDSLLAMYNNKKLSQCGSCDKFKLATAAPGWSVVQREALCRLRRIVYWWIEERQAANGELGGKLDDDVELLRKWTPLILVGDTTVWQGWQRLADGIWNSSLIYKGYSKRPRDVEHAAEPVADTAPLMLLFRDNQKNIECLKYSLDYFENLWTGITPNNHRFFRSAWFSSREVERDPPKNRDVEYNTRAVKTVRYLAWKTKDLRAIRTLHEWSQAWRDAALLTDKGKPAGIIPASIRYPDEAINGDEPDWYKANMFWPYYDWAWHVGSLMLDQLLFTSILTEDKTLLKPMYLYLELVREYYQANQYSSVASTAGSSEWTVQEILKNPTFWSVVSQWRLLTGDSQYDDLLLTYGSPYVRYRLTRNEEYLLDGLDSLLQSVRYNFPLLTSEVLHTDRVFIKGEENLTAMLTGNGVSSCMSPYFAVSWEKTDETFTALITDSGQDKLTVQLFSHADYEYQIIMRIWQLMPGNYWLYIYENKKEIIKEKITVKNRGERIPLLLPARKLLIIKLKRAN